MIRYAAIVFAIALISTPGHARSTARDLRSPQIRCVDQLGALKNKAVFCRVDFNVPLDKQGRIVDNTRIKAAIPTIKYLLDSGAKVICASHLGRPDGRVVPELRMKPVAAELSRLLGKERVVVAGHQRARQALRGRNRVVLLENLRFDPREEANDPSLSKELGRIADVYVNDAFGTAHRAHASTAGMVPHFKQKAAGFLLTREIEQLGRLNGETQKPFVAVIGGKKVSDKVGMLNKLLDRVDVLLIGGAMAQTFIKAKGGQVGRSLVENDHLDQARQIMKRAEGLGVRLMLPVDAVAAGSIDAKRGTVVPAEAIPADKMALDIGPRTRALFGKQLKAARTVFWNGPVGVFEQKPFSRGTRQLARAIARSNAFSVVGGGDTVAAVQAAGVADKISHLSTGGGASLKFLEGGTLPALVPLQQSR